LRQPFFYGSADLFKALLLIVIGFAAQNEYSGRSLLSRDHYRLAWRPGYFGDMWQT
jgi:hypothetical protein